MVRPPASPRLVHRVGNLRTRLVCFFGRTDVWYDEPVCPTHFGQIAWMLRLHRPKRVSQRPSAFHAEGTKPKPESASVYLILADRREFRETLTEVG